MNRLRLIRSRFYSLLLSIPLILAGCQTDHGKLTTEPSRTDASSSKKMTGASAKAPITVSGMFGHNMVLQQGMEVPVWGWGEDGQTVSVSFGSSKAIARVKDGRWTARLPSVAGGSSETLLIENIGGGNAIRFTNVTAGEVWICSGQSNMEFPLNKSFESARDIASATNPLIRLYTVPKLKAGQPTNNVPGRWVVCTPETVGNFSAVGYYFGRSLQESRKVPVGLIHTSWGGSPAEAWMSEETLRKNPDYAQSILDIYPSQVSKYQENLAGWEKEKADLEKEGKKISRNRPNAPWRPAELYNGMIAPVIPAAIRGAIWYQGESNAGRAYQYRTLFPDMIRNWRQGWGQGEFPFLAVQLAPYKPIKDQPGESDWAELREAQWLATKSMKNVGMAVITDVGDEKDIHPTKKAPAGERLALAARKIVYGEKIVGSGPSYKQMQVKGNKVYLSFDNVGTGLESRGGALKGFSIAGSDHKFVWAPAEIQNNQVVVSSPNVDEPVAVRFGWADFPVVNLHNLEGLPATPFRTDDFPMITKK